MERFTILSLIAPALYGSYGRMRGSAAAFIERTSRVLQRQETPRRARECRDEERRGAAIRKRRRPA